MSEALPAVNGTIARIGSVGHVYPNAKVLLQWLRLSKECHSHLTSRALGEIRTPDPPDSKSETATYQDYFRLPDLGIYTGREDSLFWRLCGTLNKVEAVSAKAPCEKDAVPLGVDIMHSVINSIDQLTGAINNSSPFCEPSGLVWLARR